MTQTPPDAATDASTEEPATPDFTALGKVASAALSVGALGCVGVFVLALTRASSSLGVDQIITFYVMPLALAGAFVAATRLAPTRRISIVLLLVASGVGLVLAEGVLLVASQNARDLNRPGGDTPSIAETVQAARARGESLYPTVPGNILVNEDATIRVGDRDMHPITPAPGGRRAVLCDEYTEPLIYIGDRHGFNNPDDAWDQEDLELALVGDSYTHGVCVPPGQQLADVLRNDVPLLNLGVRGAGPYIELGLIREFASQVAPPEVMWIYYEGNDRYDVVYESQRPWLTEYLDPSHVQGLFDHPEEVADGYAQWVDDVLDRGPLGGGVPRLGAMSVLTAAPRLASLRAVLGFGVAVPTRASRIGDFPEVFAQAAADVRSWGGRLTLVYMPSYERYRVLVGAGAPGKDEILAAAEAVDVDVIDLDAVFTSGGNPKDFWAHPRGHLNAEGYRVTAEEIRMYLEANDR
ncbi:MAG: hypothetical protein AAF389_01660 [Gemmatimonadota bacterium]